MTAKNTPLSDDQVREAIEAYRKGDTAKMIGARFDRSFSAISALMRRRGVTRGQEPTRYRDPEFLRLRREGKTAPQIAVVLDVKSKVVESWISQAIAAGLIKKVERAKVWSADDDARLKKLWVTKGPAEISRETDWSKTQIERRARKLGLPKRGYPLTRKSVVGRKIVGRKQRDAEKAARAAARVAAIEARKAEAAVMWTPTVTSRPFLERPDGGCRWPMGDGAETYACCKPVEGRETYCAHHRMLAGGGRSVGYAAASAPRGRGRPSVFDRGHAQA